MHTSLTTTTPAATSTERASARGTRTHGERRTLRRTAVLSASACLSVAALAAPAAAATAPAPVAERTASSFAWEGVRPAGGLLQPQTAGPASFAWEVVRPGGGGGQPRP